MAWYVQAVERDLGLPNARADARHLDACLHEASALLIDQVKFHEKTVSRCSRIEHTLHSFGIGLLVFVLCCCAVHLLPSFGLHLPEWLPPLLTFFCGFFPALGAALAGILDQGEFRRVGKRSESMCQQLPFLIAEIEKLRSKINANPSVPSHAFASEATALLANAARFLIHEVLDWRLVFLDRPLKEPS
jgi:hypothetical protein